MRNRFDEQLERLNVELIRMGALCEDVISQAAKTLETPTDEFRQTVYDTDHEIDRKERDIESLCMRLLLQQQPVASDLRLISSALKMISDMERIGDQAADDDVVDALFNRVKKELVELIARDHANGEDCIDLLMIAKYFERIGDHAVNIAEWVEFAATGQHG